jgi:hypothetical protein
MQNSQPSGGGAQTPESIQQGLKQSRHDGMKEGYDFLVQQGLGTMDENGKFTANEFLGRMTPVQERANIAAREAGLTDIGQTQQRANRQLRGIQGQTGVTGPAAGAQQMELLRQGQLARAGLERGMQENLMAVEGQDLDRRAREQLLGLSLPMQFGGLGSQEAASGHQLGLGYKGMELGDKFLSGLMYPPEQGVPAQVSDAAGGVVRGVNKVGEKLQTPPWQDPRGFFSTLFGG